MMMPRFKVAMALGVGMLWATVSQAQCPAAPIDGDATQALSTAVRLSSEQGHGTGVFISSDGALLTAAHVLNGQTTMTVGIGAGLELEGRVLRSNKTLDLALLQVNGQGFPCAPLSVDTLPIGAPIFAIGHPHNAEAGMSLTRGVVSGFPRADGQVFLQTDAAISPGFSGGPLFSSEGEVVGITTHKLTGGAIEGVSFAVPASVVSAWLSSKDDVPVVTLLPADQQLTVDGWQVLDNDGTALSIEAFATRIGRDRIANEVAELNRKGDSAWRLNMAAIPFAAAAPYYGYWLQRSPTPSPQFKVAAAGTGISVLTSLLLLRAGLSRQARQRNVAYSNYYSSTGLERTVERYNAGEEQ